MYGFVLVIGEEVRSFFKHLLVSMVSSASAVEEDDQDECDESDESTDYSANDRTNVAATKGEIKRQGSGVRNRR